MKNLRKKLALISTGISVVEPITSIVKELSPETDVFNIVDDIIVKTIAANNNIITPSVFKRLTTYFILAEEAGADAALITCSSVSEAVDIARPFVKIPIFKIDEPMADKAVSIGTSIGVAATLATTLEPTKRLLLSRAKMAGKIVNLEETLCEGAFEALIKNKNPEKHNQIVKNAVIELLNKCDVVVLAQASMARAIEGLDHIQERVLTSPRLGVTDVLNYLNKIE